MMKKITLVLMAFAFMIQTSFGQQVVFEETFQNYTALAEAPPTGWVTLNEDGLTVNASYTDQGAFLGGNWEHENFGAPFSPGIWSCSNVTPVAGVPVSNWLISPSITLLAAPALEIEIVSSVAAQSVEVRYATTLAGATPVATDFTALLTTLTTTGAYTVNAVDVSALAGQSVYFAFVDVNTDGDILGMRNFQILEQVATDLQIDEITFGGTKSNIDGLIVDYATFCDAALVNVSIVVTNKGISPITTFDASFDNTSSTATETFVIPSLANGASTTVTFVAQANVDTFDAYFIDAWVNLTGDAIQSNDSTLGGNLTLMVTPKPDTITVANSFYTSFEQFDGTDLANITNAFWTFENPDGNPREFQVVDNSTSGSLTDGMYSLELLGDNASANNDWAFSPCMYFDANNAYVISLKAFVGSYTSGAPVPATLALHLMSDDNAASSVTNLGSILADDNVNFTEYFLSFSPAVSGVYNLGLNQATTTQDWSVWVDEFAINVLPAPTAPNVTSAWEPCSSTATLTFAYDPTNTYTVDWNDGSAVETVTSGTPTHVYTTSAAAYNAIVTVSNIAGNDNNSVAVNASALPTPDASFSYVQVGTADVTVDFTANQNITCYTYDWDFGDNSVHESGTSAMHEYLANGTYTATLFIQDPTTSDFSSISKEVVITGVLDPTIAINEIDFVNGVNVFPNPASDVLNINFELNSVQNVEISLYSIDGKVVNAISNSTSTVSEAINTSKLDAGVYILDVTTDAGKFTTNVVVK